MNDFPNTPSVCKIFLSCVTKEFRPHREILTKDLNLPNVKVQVQEDFVQGGHSTLEKLDEYIKGCTAVIHLVGSATGSMPSSTEVAALLKRHSDFHQRIPSLNGDLENSPPSFSYTQWEAWLAIYHNVPCYVYQAEPTAVRTPGFVEKANERQAQEQHWNRFQAHGKDRTIFRDEQQLCRLVLRSLSNILPSGNQKLNVIPKGLRSFDANDSDFFLGLLPGPRDKDGLPESIRFWKHRIEERDETTFTVGVIYGPSGCGKSSLMKAGLLPRLSEHILWVYVEATANDTEARLLRGLRKRCPGLPFSLDLAESIAELEAGKRLKSEQKVVLIIDQFEQWLHATRSQQNTELVQALRQCGGVHVQCIVLVRDDFWLTISRFMGELQINLQQGQNLSLVDLFDLIHAHDILAAFGRGFGRIGQDSTQEQEVFLKRAVAELAQDGRVVPVRLALFAEMVKGKMWIPATITAVGGTEGVGVTFLDETFASRSANPKHRIHEKAAQAVLKSLLPESGTDIKGHMRSHAELLAASGYSDTLRDFEDLIRILDSEVRLITPTDPEGKEGASAESISLDEKYYQLTHDYLVPSLREWLTRKQKETRRGRAELVLAERAAVWGVRQENRQLPSLWQWLSIRCLTAKNRWTPQQRKMMRKAEKHHHIRCGAVALLLIVGSLIAVGIDSYVQEWHNADHAAGLVKQLLAAKSDRVSAIISEIESYRRWADPLLRKERDSAAEASTQKLHASLALLPVDREQIEYLQGRLLDCKPEEVDVLRDALYPYRDELHVRLWNTLEHPIKSKESQRLRAAAALARFDPEGAQWSNVQESVVNDLVNVPALNLDSWVNALRPIREKLLPGLTVVFRDESRGETERSLATDILIAYAGNRPELLVSLIQDANDKQFNVIFPVLEAQRDSIILGLELTLSNQLESSKTEKEKETLAKRRANAGGALIRLGKPMKAWALLKHSADPRARSYLIHRLKSYRIDPGAIIAQLQIETDVSARRALLLCLGEFPEQTVRDSVFEKIWQMYEVDPDPGIHGAAEWLLRCWEENQRIEAQEKSWSEAEKSRGNAIKTIARTTANPSSGNTRYWYIDPQGHTMVVIPGPTEFIMGSPVGEEGRVEGPKVRVETQHKKLIPYSFALGGKEVSLGQFRIFYKDYYNNDYNDYNLQYAPTDECPTNAVNWYQAVEYCNWLSSKAGLPESEWCYQKNKSGKYAAGMTVASDYLKRRGYRLPTEAEWEYCSRAKAATCRHYGETEELLDKYAWYSKNSHSQGMLPGKFRIRGNDMRPNDFGMFSMLGNAMEWVHDSVSVYLDEKDASPKEEVISDSVHRVLRGGSFQSQASLLRSACRLSYPPTRSLLTAGFRVARTITIE